MNQFGNVRARGGVRRRRVSSAGASRTLGSRPESREQNSTLACRLLPLADSTRPLCNPAATHHTIRTRRSPPTSNYPLREQRDRLVHRCRWRRARRHQREKGNR